MSDLFTFEATPETKQAFAELERVFARIGAPSVSDIKPVSSAINEGFAQNFASESAGGSPWAALAPATMLDRIRQGYGGSGPILERTGDYKASWIEVGDGDHIEQVQADTSGFTMEVGSQHRLSKWHEFGTSRMPARPASNLSSEAESRVFAELNDLFDRLLGEAFK